MATRTKRQREILNFIQTFIDTHGFQPSYQQIANQIGVKSKGGVAKHIEALEKNGLIARHNINGTFHLELTPQKVVSEYITEIEWLKNPNIIPKKYETENLYVPTFLLGYLSSISLRAMTVRDDGMLDAQICNGDIAIIENKTFIRDSEVIAALIPNEPIFLRKYYRLSDMVELVPDNENYDTISIPGDKLKIFGVFRGILRPFT